MKDKIFYYLNKFKTIYNDIKKFKLKILLLVNFFLMIWYIILYNNEYNELILLFPILWGILYYNNNIISIIASSLTANYLFKSNINKMDNNTEVILKTSQNIVESSYNSYYYILSLLFISISCIIFFTIYNGYKGDAGSNYELKINNYELQNDNFKLMNENLLELSDNIKLYNEIDNIKNEIYSLKQNNITIENENQENLNKICDIIDTIKDAIDTKVIDHKVTKIIDHKITDYEIMTNNVNEKIERIVQTAISSSSFSDFTINLLEHINDAPDITEYQDVSTEMDDMIKTENLLKQ